MCFFVAFGIFAPGSDVCFSGIFGITFVPSDATNGSFLKHQSMKKILLGLLGAGLVLFSACNDDDKSNASRVRFYLTDAPAEPDYKAVWIDVQSISYSVSGENWVMLPFRPAKIDVLQFANGADTLLSDIRLRSGQRVQQIRLLLGSDNTLELGDGSTHPLGTPSGQTSGIKLNVQSAAPVSGSYKVIIDFDATRSIVAKGNGGYALKPVIRAFIEANTSSIMGKLMPADVATRVFTITMQQDTVATVSDTTRNNMFLLRGLPAGTYDIQGQDLSTGAYFNLKSGVSLMAGEDADVGELQLPL